MNILYQYLKKLNLLKSQDLWQVLYQILLMILWKEFTKLICKDCNCFFEYESVNDNLINYKCLPCNNNYPRKIEKILKY